MRAERMARILLIVMGVALALIGLRYFFDPGALTAETGVVAPSTKAVMEIRTVYGGMFVGVGAALIALAARHALVAGLWVLILVFGAVALARIAAVLLGQAPDTLFVSLLIVELVGVGLAVIALRGIGGAPR